jgi:hypothetical protein
MILFWRKKAAFKDKKNVPEGEEESADDVLYLGFTLCKVDVEHLCALQSIAAAIGVAVGNFSLSFMHAYSVSVSKNPEIGEPQEVTNIRDPLRLSCPRFRDSY